MHFQRLPIEIQFDVFATLTAKDLCSVVAPVSRQWRQYAYEPTLWKDVQLDGTIHTSPQMAQILQHSRQTRRLELNRVKDFSWMMETPKSKSLREIQFISCEMSIITISHLRHMYPYVQHCSYFRLNVGDYVYGYVKQFVQWHYLTEISLKRILNKGEPVIMVLDMITKSCENILSLEMPLRDEPDCAFANFLKLRGPQLQCLKVYCGRRISSDSYQLLSQCRQLKQLKIYNAVNFTDVNLFGLSELKHLNRLKLSLSRVLFAMEYLFLYPNVDFHAIEEVTIASCGNLDDTALHTLVSYFGYKTLTVVVIGTMTTATCLSMADEFNWQVVRVEAKEGLVVFTK